MRLLKPNWVSHDGNAIFSIDIHPDASRFATGLSVVASHHVIHDAVKINFFCFDLNFI